MWGGQVFFNAILPKLRTLYVVSDSKLIHQAFSSGCEEEDGDLEEEEDTTSLECICNLLWASQSSVEKLTLADDRNRGELERKVDQEPLSFHASKEMNILFASGRLVKLLSASCKFPNLANLEMYATSSSQESIINLLKSSSSQLKRMILEGPDDALSTALESEVILSFPNLKVSRLEVNANFLRNFKSASFGSLKSLSITQLASESIKLLISVLISNSFSLNYLRLEESATVEETGQMPNEEDINLSFSNLTELNLQENTRLLSLFGTASFKTLRSLEINGQKPTTSMKDLLPLLLTNSSSLTPLSLTSLELMQEEIEPVFQTTFTRLQELKVDTCSATLTQFFLDNSVFPKLSAAAFNISQPYLRVSFGSLSNFMRHNSDRLRTLRLEGFSQEEEETNFGVGGA